MFYLFRQSEAALESVTATIKRSFAESCSTGYKSSVVEHQQHQPQPQQSGQSVPERNCKPHQHQKQKQHLQSTSSANPGQKAFEQVMSEMDQVFNRLLQEDIGSYIFHSLLPFHVLDIHVTIVDYFIFS